MCDFFIVLPMQPLKDDSGGFGAGDGSLSSGHANGALVALPMPSSASQMVSASSPANVAAGNARVFFGVVDAKPANSKTLRLPVASGCNLCKSDVAITIHAVKLVIADGEDDGCILLASQPSDVEGQAHPVQILSGLDQVTSELVRDFRVHPKLDMSYLMDIPGAVLDEALLGRFLTKLVHQQAYGAGGSLLFSDADLQPMQQIVAALVDAGVVVSVGDGELCGFHGFKLTAAGLSRLQCWHTAGPDKPLVNIPARVTLQDVQSFSMVQLLLALEDMGWSYQQRTKPITQKMPPITLPLQSQQKIIHVHVKDQVLRTKPLLEYLQCLAVLEELKPHCVSSWELACIC